MTDDTVYLIDSHISRLRSEVLPRDFTALDYVPFSDPAAWSGARRQATPPSPSMTIEELAAIASFGRLAHPISLENCFHLWLIWRGTKSTRRPLRKPRKSLQKNTKI